MHRMLCRAEEIEVSFRRKSDISATQHKFRFWRGGEQVVASLP